jgi:preprotein translocase subunit YajC
MKSKKKKKSKNWKEIKFTKEDFNDYAILFFLTVICIIFLYVINHPIFLFPIVILIIYGVNESLKKYQKKKSHQSLKGIKGLNFIRIKINLFFSLWLIGLISGVIGILYFLSKIFLFQYITILTYLQVLAPILMIIGFFVFFIGRLGKVQFESISKPLKIIEVGGFVLILGGIFFFSLKILASDSFLFSLVFYTTMFIGALCLFIEELYEKNKGAYIVSLITAGLVLLGLLLHSYTDRSLFLSPLIVSIDLLSYTSLLATIQLVSLLILFFSGGFYLIKEKISATKMKEKEKKFYVLIIKISAIIWVVSFIFLAVSFI